MHRRARLIALILLLAACGRTDDRAPFTDSRVPPGLAQQDWPPPGWTWGLIQVGNDPPQRYGVAAAHDVPRAQVLILPGYGETAEETFAAVNDFSARGCVVWVLDGQGQGGSARAVEPRDLGYLRSFDDDVAAVRQLTQAVIRPTRDAPLVLVADGTAAPVALRALQQGAPGVSGLVLAGPRILPPGAPVAPAKARWMERLGFGGLRAPGGRPWRRDAPDPDTLGHDWRTANPDLRMGGPSYAWLAAFDDLLDALAVGEWRRVDVPVVIVPAGRDGDVARRLCRSIARCRIEAGGDAHAAAVAAVEAAVAALPASSLSKSAPGR